MTTDAMKLEPDSREPVLPTPQDAYRPYVVVKLRDGIGPANGVAIIRRMLSDAGFAGEFEVDRLFRSASPARIAQLQEEARRLNPDYARQAADLNTYFAVYVAAPLIGRLVEILPDDPRVELAYEPVGPQPPPGLVTPGDNPFDYKQTYLDPAPGGIDAWYGWELLPAGIAGSDGAGIGFIDIEQGWLLTHPDLAAAGINVLSGVNKVQVGHGTSVLGIVRAVNNNLFCVGIANQCQASTVSEWRTNTDFSRPDAILDAINRLAFGDVLLIESQILGKPVEIEKANFDAIRLGTALGIIVVEPTGNGGENLDTYVITWGSLSGTFLNRGLGATGGFRDSGAIVVGCATATAPHSPVSGTGYGSRVDCFAWGEKVFTLGDTISELDAGFNSTSAASAIVAGAALVVQGAIAANFGFRVSPETMRTVLTAVPNSTPSKDPPSDLIGRMPDLHAIFESADFKLAPDVYLRDFVGDTGDPHTGPISNSPDIIIRAVAAADPQASFGEGSGTENDVGLSDTVQAGIDHHLYVRVRDRGAAAVNVQADVYWAPSSTLVMPDSWTLIGSVVIPMVPSGDVLTVSNEIPWPAAKIPGAGHYCFVALIGAAGDPPPTTADFGDMDAFMRFVRERNNATWRNFNVESGSAMATPGYGAALELPFDVTGPPDEPLPMQIEIIGGLPGGARAWIEMPLWMAPADRLGGPGVRFDRDAGVASLPINPRGRTRLGEFLLSRRARIPLRLIVGIEDEQRRHNHEIAVRQSWRGKEVGRITWRIARIEAQPGSDDGVRSPLNGGMDG